MLYYWQLWAENQLSSRFSLITIVNMADETNRYIVFDFPCCCCIFFFTTPLVLFNTILLDYFVVKRRSRRNPLGKIMCFFCFFSGGFDKDFEADFVYCRNITQKNIVVIFLKWKKAAAKDRKVSFKLFKRYIWTNFKIFVKR